jgi:hypothetical protein
MLGSSHARIVVGWTLSRPARLRVRVLPARGRPLSQSDRHGSGSRRDEIPTIPVLEVKKRTIEIQG